MDISEYLRACSVGTVPFRSPIQMVRFLPFQNGKNPLFTMETVAERNGTVPNEQALKAIYTIQAGTGGTSRFHQQRGLSEYLVLRTL